MLACYAYGVSLSRDSRLSRALILDAARAIADRGGLAALSMRKLGQVLGVEAMSLYNHVANKDELLDGMVDLVFGEIGLPAGEDWKTAMRARAIAVRAALTRHPWALGLMESRRRPGPETLRHHNAVIGCLRQAGFSIPLAAHAYSLLDSFIYGFALNEQSLPFESPEQVSELGSDMLRGFPSDAYPYLAEFIVGHAMRPGYDYANEFDFGLELILDALDNLLAEDARADQSSAARRPRRRT
jgi:AcrR family transcriptional regulator